uniref:Short chain dehydrogenase n=1 Tax=Heterorhabditis bacteriophora TaxID=37862 RepID=A0A1I7WX50_HETBA
MSLRGRIAIVSGASRGYIIENLTKKFYESDPDLWDKFNNVGLRNHYFCVVLGARIMNKQGRGLIVNVGSPGGLYTLFNIPYGVGKCALDRMSKDMAQHLKDTKITVVSLWPGAVKTELIMNAVENSKNGLGLDNINTLFLNGESIEYSGKAVVSLALDPKVHTFAGKILFTADLGHKYKFKDIDATKFKRDGNELLLKLINFFGEARLEVS